jgi:hypothetical protein
LGGADDELDGYVNLFFGSLDHNLIGMNKFKQERLLLDKFY